MLTIMNFQQQAFVLVFRKHQPTKGRKLIFHHKPTLPMTYCLCETRCGNNKMCNKTSLKLNAIIMKHTYLENKCVLANSINLFIYLIKVHKNYDKKKKVVEVYELTIIL